MENIYKVSKYLPTKYHLNQIIKMNIIRNEIKSNLITPARRQ